MMGSKGLAFYLQKQNERVIDNHGTLAKRKRPRQANSAASAGRGEPAPLGLSPRADRSEWDVEIIRHRIDVSVDGRSVIHTPFSSSPRLDGSNDQTPTNGPHHVDRSGVDTLPPQSMSPDGRAELGPFDAFFIRQCRGSCLGVALRLIFDCTVQVLHSAPQLASHSSRSPSTSSLLAIFAGGTGESSGGIGGGSGSQFSGDGASIVKTSNFRGDWEVLHLKRAALRWIIQICTSCSLLLGSLKPLHPHECSREDQDATFCLFSDIKDEAIAFVTNAYSSLSATGGDTHEGFPEPDAVRSPFPKPRDRAPPKGEVLDCLEALWKECGCATWPPPTSTIMRCADADAGAGPGTIVLDDELFHSTRIIAPPSPVAPPSPMMAKINSTVPASKGSAIAFDDGDELRHLATKVGGSEAEPASGMFFDRRTLAGSFQSPGKDEDGEIAAGVGEEMCDKCKAEASSPPECDETTIGVNIDGGSCHLSTSHLESTSPRRICGDLDVEDGSALSPIGNKISAPPPSPPPQQHDAIHSHPPHHEVRLFQPYFPVSSYHQCPHHRLRATKELLQRGR